MNEYSRPDPEKLLKEIQAEERLQTRGRLKIFLGYAAGVGKTYAMLEAAHQRLMTGWDVVVGIVETHGRIETETLLKGLEIVPLRQVVYRGTNLSEMDMDVILARHPQLVLVDELAHTNAPDSRHPKRYQDVEELLENGISVYTTLNIQHLESLNDVVQQITGVAVRETIPNRIIDEADEIEVIDLPPDELLDRLKSGKVYVPEQAARAIQLFFRKGNLTALREIALRHAAERVDTQMRDYMETKDISGPWPASDRILVAVSAHPMCERLVRTARRLADNLDAEWYAVYVETPDRMRFSAVHSERVARTLRLAEELGAHVVTLSGGSIPEAILDYAHKHNVTKIVAGKPLRPRWFESIRGSILDEIIRGSGTIDVYVISDTSGPIPADRTSQWQPHHAYRYFYSVLTVALVTLVSFPIQSLIHPVNLVILYLAAVVVSALYFGRGPSMLASLLGVLAFDFFFIEPRISFNVSDTQYLLTFLGLLVVGLIISNLTARVKDQVEAIQKKQDQTQILFSLSQDLTTAVDMDAVVNAIIDHIGQTLGRDVAIFLPVNGKLELRAANSGFHLDENGYAVAVWAFDHGQPTGRGTETLSAAAIRAQPLKTMRGILGVLGVSTGDSNSYLNPEQRRLFEAYTSLAAVAIERALLDEQAREAQVLRESERLQTALLNSISHDLRTPLATITGALDSLQEAERKDGEAVFLDADAKMDLIQTAREEAHRLNLLVGNLLDMTRLESGALQLHKVETDVQDLISTALSHMRDRLRDHPLKVHLPDHVPFVFLDFILMEQVLMNLLDNAIKYSPAGTPIKIAATLTHTQIQITVADQGIGIPVEDLTRVFDKFYRIERLEDVHGTGLGLSICKGIVEAHGGLIWAENGPDGGTHIIFTLPLKVTEDHLTEAGRQ